MKRTIWIAVATVLLASGCGKTKQNEANEFAAKMMAKSFPGMAAMAAKEVESEKKSDAELRKNTITLGQTLTLGNLEIKPVKVEMKTVSGTTHGKPWQTEKPVLVLTFTAKNISDGQVFKPIPFQYRAVDNFGNKLDRLTDSDFTGYYLDGSEELKDLQPGSTATISIALKLKTNKATECHWNIYQTVNNQEKDRSQHWGIKHTASEVQVP